MQLGRHWCPKSLYYRSQTTGAEGIPTRVLEASLPSLSRLLGLTVTSQALAMVMVVLEVLKLKSQTRGAQHALEWAGEVRPGCVTQGLTLLGETKRNVKGSRRDMRPIVWFQDQNIQLYMPNKF